MGNGTLSVALCHVVPKYIVICAIVRGTGYTAVVGKVTNSVYAIALPLPFPFFSNINDTKKKCLRGCLIDWWAS